MLNIIREVFKNKTLHFSYNFLRRIFRLSYPLSYVSEIFEYRKKKTIVLAHRLPREH